MAQMTQQKEKEIKKARGTRIVWEGNVKVPEDVKGGDTIHVLIEKQVLKPAIKAETKLHIVITKSLEDFPTE